VPDLADKNPVKLYKVQGDAVSYFGIYKKNIQSIPKVTRGP
jgi:hypothetical protein